MSMTLMVKALQNKVGNPLRKLVLIKLADNANDQGECWPSFQHIADQCEISRRSVINHVNELENAGILKRIRRDGPKGNTSNLYLITIPSASLSLPSAFPALPPSESPAPRTSHSLEPVKEPYKQAKQVCPYDLISKAYNENRGMFPECKVMNDKRKRLAKKFYKMLNNDIDKVGEYFAYVCAKLESKPFYSGNNNAGWRANFEYLMREDVITKAIEGIYEEAIQY